MGFVLNKSSFDNLRIVDIFQSASRHAGGNIIYVIHMHR